MPKILIIEDEIQIMEVLELELSYEGYDVDKATDGRSGLDKIEKGDYDIVLLDIMLPELNGIEVCRRARRFTNIPIIIITARDQVIDKVTGLDTGADDYLTKPFPIEELLARIRSALRRKSMLMSEISTLNYKNITLNKSACEVRLDDKIIEFTKKEYQLLEYMLDNRNQVLTREQILDAVWGFDYFGNNNVVDVYIRYLRNKLNENSGEKYITTVRGTGYIMKDV